MSRLLLPMVFGFAFAGLLLVPASLTRAAPPPAGEERLVEDVRESIAKGVRYLKKIRGAEGHWDDKFGATAFNFLTDMEGGRTALVALALLTSGVQKDDPALAPAIEYLRKLPLKKTYVVALVTMVLAEVREEKDQPLIQRNADWLIQHGMGWKVVPDNKVLRVEGKLAGWSYPQNQVSDNSNTQYALLGLYAAKQAGAKIDRSVWLAIQEYYKESQQDQGNTGYWTYYPGRLDRAPSISMTVAGVCGLHIARMGLDTNEHELDPATGIAKNCGKYDEDSALAKGMRWVVDNFVPKARGDGSKQFDRWHSPKSTFYNIYGIERLGRLSGHQFIGKVDWYREGCEMLVKLQHPDGSFSAGNSIDSSPTLATAFSLLFLAKGRTPVLISKMAWGEYKETTNGIVDLSPMGFPAPQGSANWNRKHNDTRHMVEFCSRELFDGVPLAWQVYDPRRQAFDADPAGTPGGRSQKEKILDEVGVLLQSPILYINGHGPIRMDPVQDEILKTYIEEGGFVVAEACCGDPTFAKSFREKMRKLFPENTLRPMSSEHAIWRMFPGVVPTDFPDLEVLERGCRTVAVFSPSPLAGYWEEAKYMPEDSKRPQNRGEKAFSLIRNIVGYATGMELPRPKLSRTKLVAAGAETGVSRSHFKALQLDFGDNPAPDALRNLMGYLRDNARLEVALQSATLPAYDEQVFNFKFMYIHGRKPLDLSEAEIETIQANLQAGGLLLADAACNSYEQWKAFDKSFRATCEKLFPKHKLQVIEARTADGKEDPLFKIASDSGINIKSVRCRRELPGDKGPEPEMRNYPVVLEGIKIDGRWVVIYSKYDIGCAIEGHKAADCLGHDKESALRIGAAVVLYALKR